MKRTTLITGIATTLLAFAVHAENPQKPAFESLDKDGNGQISAAEAAEHQEFAAKIAELDTDGDGAISREEFEALRVAEAPAATSSSPPTDGAESASDTPDSAMDSAQQESETSAPDTDSPPTDSATLNPPTS